MDAFNSTRQEFNQIEQFLFSFTDQVDDLTSWLEVMYTTRLQQHTLLPENLTLVYFCFVEPLFMLENVLSAFSKVVSEKETVYHNAISISATAAVTWF